MPFCTDSEGEQLVAYMLVGHLFSNDVNQEQGNTIVKYYRSLSSKALSSHGHNDYQTKVMKDMPSSSYG
jgi:hypothetical protein